MPPTASSPRPALVPFARHARGRRTLWLLVGSLAVSTCSDETGPHGPVPGYLALAPRFEASSAGIVPVARGRFVLTRQPGGEVALDTILAIAPDADSVDLSLTVSLQAPGETLLLSIALIGPAPANDTVFRAGPLEVTPSSSGAPAPIDVPLTYTGVGANAASVVLILPDGPIVAGVPTPVLAAAFDSAGQPIPGVPVAFRSLDPLIATVPDVAIGAVLGVARGSARVVAELLTGPADTGLVSVTLPPSVLVADSGSGQTGPAAGLLPAPLVARVTASDGVGVPDVWVRFAVTLGGGSVSADSVLTDGTGGARVDWTLGNIVGAQTVAATVPGIPPVAFTATSVATGAGAITVVAGNNQSALVGTAVGTAPQVRVTDAQGNPVPNEEVVFAVTQGGGSVTGATATTDAQGLASVGSWTLGAAVGLNALTAAVGALTPVQFVALATSTGGVTSMTLNAGDGQTTLAGTAVSIAPSVLLTDTAGAPVAGVEVPFTIGGGGTLADTTPASDASGIASVGVWTLGAPGTNTLTASLPGLPNVSFSADATVGAPAQVIIVSGDAQSDTAGTTLADPLVVEVRDSAGNPVPGVTVSWATLDGTITPPSATTGATGRAQASWTLSTNKVTQTATATVSGLTPAVFTATAIFPNPSILLVMQGGDRVRVGTSDTLEVTLTAPAGVDGVFVSVVSSNPAILRVDTTTGGVLIPEGGTTGLVFVEGLTGGTVTLTASAAGFANGVLSVPVSVQVLSMPSTLNVPFGATASLPVQISAPAPEGGVTVTLVSDAPTLLNVATPTVTIAEGSQTANATLEGLLPGPANVTGTTADFGAAVTAATVTATLNITVANVTIDASFGADLTVRLESGGSPIAAPSPGVPVTLTPANPTCVAAETPVTITTGLVSATSAISYGGTATLPCTSWVVATAENITADSVNVTVNPPPGINLSAAFYGVGAGLQIGSSGSLGASQHGGVDVIVKSLDPGLVLIAPNTSTMGSDSLVVFLPNGTTFFGYTLQGLEGVADTGGASAPVEVRAAGFTTDTVTHVVRRAGYRLSGVNPSTTSLTPSDPFQVLVGVMNVGNTAINQFQAVRAGGTALTATVVLSDSAVADLVTLADTGGTATVQIAVQSNSSPGSVAAGGIALDPQAAGTTTVTATIPGLVAESNATTVTITAPGISGSPVFYGVGSGLQIGASGSLGASDHGGVDVIVKSLDPGLVLIAPNASTLGGDSLVVFLPNGTTFFSYTLQGLEGVADTGPAGAPVEVRAAGFTTDTVTHTVRRAGYRLNGLNTTTTTLSPDDPFQVLVGVMNVGNTFINQFQAVRAGGTGLTATLTSGTPGVGQLVTTDGAAGQRTVTIPAQASSSPSTVTAGGVAFDPLTAGTTLVTTAIPGLVAELSDVTVTVSTPGITVQSRTVGSGLQVNSTVALGATQHGGVDVVVKSSNPAVALVSPNVSTPGTDSIVVFLANGFSSFSFYIQGVEFQTGSVLITARASGFTDGSSSSAIVTPALQISGLSTSTTAGGVDDPFTVFVGVPDVNNTFMSQVQAVRAGAPGPLTATVQTEDNGVGQLVTTASTGTSVTVQIPAGSTSSPSNVAAGGVAFDPLMTGSTTVFATIPTFIALPQATVVITVNP